VIYSRRFLSSSPAHNSFALPAGRPIRAGTSSSLAVSSTSTPNTRDASARSPSIKNTSTSSRRSAKSVASTRRRTAWGSRPPSGYADPGAPNVRHLVCLTPLKKTCVLWIYGPKTSHKARFHFTVDAANAHVSWPSDWPLVFDMTNHVYSASFTRYHVGGLRKQRDELTILIVRRLKIIWTLMTENA